MGMSDQDSPPPAPEPDLPSAPDPDLIQTIEEGGVSTLPESPDPSLMRRIDLEDRAIPMRVYSEEVADGE